MISNIQKILHEHVFFRYVISGSTSAVVDLSVLYVLNSVLHMQYLISAILAFLVAFGVSFSLHKFWTFRTDIQHDSRKQIMLYLGTSLCGLLLNTGLMYLFVDYMLEHIVLDLHVRVIIAQVFAGLLVACCTFFVSRNLVFKWHLNES